MTMELIGFYFILACSVFLFIELNFRFKLFSLLLAILMVPAYPLFANTSDWIWFDWAKRYSVLIIMLLICIAQYFHYKTGNMNNRFVRGIMLYVLPLVLLANILEATFVDLFAANYLNVITAIILIATIPNFWGRWSMSKDSIVGFGPYWDWCVLYTLWNAYLLQYNAWSGDGVFQNIYMPALIILVINVLVCLYHRDWHRWFAARAYCIFLIASLDTLFPSLLPNIQIVAPTLMIKLWGFLNVAFAACVFYKTYREKRSCLFLPHRL